ncbi:MAG: NUDIX domain-containing protein [Nanoarchaeota archaeon]|nr:NUDIX domain-containing protein [Nanoarchaeota archaeon]
MIFMGTEEELLALLQSNKENLPSFPDGRINYHDVRKTPVVTIFIKFESEILLLQRSEKVQQYRGKWNTVAGHLDEVKPVWEKAAEELSEEVGITSEHISSVKMGVPFTFVDESINKEWFIHPVLVVLKNKPDITLDWEHTQFVWITPGELAGYDIVPKVDVGLDHVLSL